jgi:hypothetical protein
VDIFWERKKMMGYCSLRPPHSQFFSSSPSIPWLMERLFRCSALAALQCSAAHFAALLLLLLLQHASALSLLL